jgi:hypothetical protein
VYTQNARTGASAASINMRNHTTNNQQNNNNNYVDVQVDDNDYDEQ